MSREAELLLLATVLLAAFFDLRERRVPNWLTASAAICGIALNVYLAHAGGLWFSLKGLGLALAVYLPLYLLRAVGGGDLKLMAAIGAIAGPAFWIAIMLLTALIGGIAAVCFVIARGRIRQTARNLGTILGSGVRGRAPYRASAQLDVTSDSSSRLPHGAAIAGAALLVLAVATLGYIKL